MEKFPILGLIVRYGAPAAAVLAAAAGVFVLALLWPLWGAAALIPAVAAGGVAYLLARSYAELVVLITDMLLPR